MRGSDAISSFLTQRLDGIARSFFARQLAHITVGAYPVLHLVEFNGHRQIPKDGGAASSGDE